MNLGGSRKESAALDACRLSGTTAPARRNRSLSAHTALYLLRSLPPVIVPNGIPAVPVSGFNAKIPMTENCASFAFPLYRDGKTARVLLSRYIGTGKLREFCFPAISGRENCASFAFPLYRDGKIARVLLSRYIGTGKLREFCFPAISGRENCASFAFPLYRDGKTARVLLSRYIGTGKLREFCFPAISGRENCASFAFPLYPRSKTVSEIVRRQCLRRFRRHSSSFSFHN